MSRRIFRQLRTTALVGTIAAVPCALAIPAVADETPDPSVGVTVEVAPDQVPGALTLSVPAEPVTLTEGATNSQMRAFTGQLFVEVKDTRSANQVDPESQWTVTGIAGDMKNHDSSQPSMPAAWLGWEPWTAGDAEWINGFDIGDRIESGYPNDTAATGLDSPRTLLMGKAWRDSTNGAAALALHTPKRVTPGSYSGTITLSLFE